MNTKECVEALIEWTTNNYDSIPKGDWDFVGKGGEMYDQLQHQRIWSEKLLREIYSDFLTEKEIISILDNKDLWMDGDEVIKRLKNKVKKAEKASKTNE